MLSFPIIISLSTNYNPITFPHSFLTPFSKIDYNQEKFCIEAVGSRSVLVGLQ
jgi:hypothetical protein